MNSLTKPSLPVLLCGGGFLFLVFGADAQAGSATWKADPSGESWFDEENWTPASVPNGPSDIATFDFSNTTSVDADAYYFHDMELDSIVFNPGASTFTITEYGYAALTLSGAGIENNYPGSIDCL